MIFSLRQESTEIIAVLYCSVDWINPGKPCHWLNLCFGSQRKEADHHGERDAAEIEVFQQAVEHEGRVCRLDAIRAVKIALDRGMGGPLPGPSAYFMKSPPVQYLDEDARDYVLEFMADGTSEEARIEAYLADQPASRRTNQ